MTTIPSPASGASPASAASTVGAPAGSFGSRATVATLVRKLEDATVGNQDGIVGNERSAAGTGAGGSPFDTNPVLFRLRAFFEVGLSKSDEEGRLATFLAAAEKAWGRPVTTAARPAHVPAADWNAHLVDKAITLVRLGRSPDDVVDGFVAARGAVDGHAIAPREVFTQTWKPSGTPSGQTIVVSPGFLETGRNYVEQIQLLNARGHEVIALDHQWAGLSSSSEGRGASGGIDRGFGIARDVAAVTAQAAASSRKVTLVGTSMGAGAGVLGAVLMNDAGKLQLDGPPMPKGLSAVLQGPFFDRTRSLPNMLLAGSGLVPGAKEIPLPALGLPILSGDQATLRKIAAHASTEHLTGRAQAFHASTEDLRTMKGLLASGARPQGRIEIIHATKDTLARYEATAEWVNLLGERAQLTTIDSTSHVFEENPAEQVLLLEGLARLGV